MVKEVLRPRGIRDFLRKSIIMSRVGSMAVQLERDSMRGDVSLLACASLLTDRRALTLSQSEQDGIQTRYAMPACGRQYPEVCAPWSRF